ncbi:MAG TPA: BTAD domain-containing putative transcriptional regulator [Pyrinomonadaceae bacterium]|jgi:DNA-binding SARP family transcriptional activator
MPAFTVHLFGKFKAEYQARPLGELEAGKAQELFSYLLVHHGRAHAREALAALLWGETATDKSKKYLRQALWHLQTALDRPGAKLLAAEHDWVRLDLGDALWLDVATFEQACALAQGVRGRELDDARRTGLSAAVALYRGDLLEGCYQDWCLYERERLQNLYLAALDKLLSHAAAYQDYEAGQTYGALLLRQDRAHERTHRQLMRLHYRAGDRTAALRQYERCRAALRTELDVEPAARTRLLYEQIRADRLDVAAPPPHASSYAPDPAAPDATAADAPAPTAATLPDVLVRLRQLQAVLTDAQQRVQHEIRAVELALKRKTQRILHR